jgi:hypothetical protein
MTLQRRLGRLEVLVKAQASPTVPTYWTPERIERWQEWARRLLLTMDRDRALRVFDELTTTPADQWGPVARRVNHMAYRGADGGYDGTGWPHWADRVVALPDAVCELLEAHGDVSFATDFNCAECGLEVPHRAGMRAPLLTTCPWCGGAVTWAGFTTRRLREYDRGRAS